MKLEKIFPILSDEAKTTIKEIVAQDLGLLVQDLGYRLVESSEAVLDERKTILPVEPTPTKKPRLKGPFELHGRSFKNLSCLAAAYGIKKTNLTYKIYQKGMTLDEVFPEPPNQKTIDTILMSAEERARTHQSS